MAAPIYISNDRNGTEVVIDNRATQEVVIVGYRYPNAQPVRIVGRFRSGVKSVKVVGPKELINGESI